jgi:hypothetical protein
MAEALLLVCDVGHARRQGDPAPDATSVEPSCPDAH